MTINYIVEGQQRKKLALTIGKWLGREVKYLGAPTFAYQIDYLNLDRDGNLHVDDSADNEVIERLMEHLHNEGFEFEDINSEPPVVDGLNVSIPLSVLGETGYQNLKDLVKAKETLLKHAFDLEYLPIMEFEDGLIFPWFKGVLSPEEVKAYTHFITALCDMAKKLTRINKSEKEKENENEKYAFRCFLLRLGFIGAEYKEERKILLQRLQGSSAFRTTNKKSEEA